MPQLDLVDPGTRRVNRQSACLRRREERLKPLAEQVGIRALGADVGHDAQLLTVALLQAVQERRPVNLGKQIVADRDLERRADPKDVGFECRVVELA